MIRDKIKLYSNWEDIEDKCHCCNKGTHGLFSCPLLHYVPDSDFLIKRFNHSKNQERNTVFLRFKRKRINARMSQNLIIRGINKMNSMLSSEDFSSSGSLSLENENEIGFYYFLYNFSSFFCNFFIISSLFLYNFFIISILFLLNFFLISS